MLKNFEYVIDASVKKLYDWKELWAYRELFYFFTWRDVKVKYKQTALGVIWVVLQPVLTVLIFTLFVGHALRVPSGGLPYPVFVFSGLLFWSLFSSSINSAGNSMTSNAPIIKKIYFPRIIIPVSSILVCCLDFVISFCVFLMLLLLYGASVDIVGAALFWPGGMMLTLVSTLGIGSLLAALVVKYKDFRFVIPFGLQIGLFLTPVIYPISIFDNGWISSVVALNPLHGAIMLFRAPLGIPIDRLELVISASSGLSLLFWGLYYFKKTEAHFADIA